MKEWYTLTTEWLKNSFDQWELMADLIASTSPRKTLKDNLKLSIQIYSLYKLEYPITKRLLKHLGLMTAHINNVLRCFSGETLSGSKVLSFSKNLKGNLDAVTIDTWIIRYYKLNKDSLTPLQYKKLSKRIIKHAKRLNLKPAELQAIIWFKIRPLSKYNTYMDVVKDIY